MSDDTQSFLDFLDADMPAIANALWQIDNDHQAIWALRKIAKARAQVEARAAFVRGELEKMTVWLEQAQRQSSREEAFFEGKLHGYVLRLQAEGKLGKKKSWSLPNGRLQLTAQPARYDVGDEAALLAYATEYEAITVTVKPDLALLRQWCADGTEVPGMVLARPAMETFSVKLTEDQTEG